MKLALSKRTNRMSSIIRCVFCTGPNSGCDSWRFTPFKRRDLPFQRIVRPFVVIVRIPKRSITRYQRHREPQPDQCNQYLQASMPPNPHPPARHKTTSHREPAYRVPNKPDTFPCFHLKRNRSTQKCEEQQYFNCWFHFHTSFPTS